jgi:predicted transcriptional regulator of viral defense system
MEHKKYNYIEEHLSKIRANGGFTFSYSGLSETFSVSEAALNLALQRLKRRKVIAQVKKGFYIILPPEYVQKGMIPANLFIDDLMKSLKKNYYVGLLSAAALHGAAHQQPMEYFVITNAPAVRKIKTLNITVNFFVKKEWPQESIVKKKTDAGYINVSSPELTALDLLFYSDKVSLNRAFTVLQELYSVLKPSALFKAAKEYPQTAAIQRLGYMLEKIPGAGKLSESLFRALSDRKCYFIPLSPAKAKKGSTDTHWKIIINTEIEGDL